MAQDDKRLAYYSLKYDKIYHTCANCDAGSTIKQKRRGFINEGEARQNGMIQCKTCKTMEATGEPACLPVRR
jgi:hypothetical protein